MSGPEMTARMEAAYTIAMLNDPALRALLLLVDGEHAKMIWSLGYMRGGLDAYDRAREILATGA